MEKENTGRIIPTCTATHLLDSYPIGDIQPKRGVCADAHVPVFENSEAAAIYLQSTGNKNCVQAVLPAKLDRIAGRYLRSSSDCRRIFQIIGIDSTVGPDGCGKTSGSFSVSRKKEKAGTTAEKCIGYRSY
ncbi:MAG: hypothetical protein IPP63_00125 [Chloracidobacterium sp.]|nr:hypothetical protein [Chloracidobacterium sp.]